MTIPTDIGNCVLWCKADVGVFKDAGVTPATLNGDAIQQWNDQSGRGNNLTQATLGNRPTLSTTQINGINTVAFAGGSSQFFSMPAIYSGATSGEIFLVFKMTAYPPTLAAKTGLWFMGGNTSDTNLWTDSQFYEAFGTNLRKNPYTPTLNCATTYRVYNVRSAPRFWEARINDVIQVSEDYNNTVSFTNTPLLGKSQSGTAFFDGNIVEIVAYNRQLSDLEREAIRDYLGITRYALWTVGNERVSQEAIEAITQPTNANVRVSQEAIEAVVLPTSPNLRASQLAVEAVVQPDAMKLRVSQLAIEVIKSFVQESNPQSTDANSGWTPFTGVVLPPMIDHDDDAKYMYSSVGAQGDSATFSVAAALPTSSPSGVRIQIRVNWE